MNCSDYVWKFFCVFGFILVISSSASANLITNGEFNVFTSATGYDDYEEEYYTYNTFTGADWKNTGTVEIIGLAGTNVAVFGGGYPDVASGVLSQKINTVSGEMYSLSFEYGAYAGPGIPQSLIVQVKNDILGQILLDQTLTDATGTNNPFRLYSYSFMALGNSTTLSFLDSTPESTSWCSDGVLDNVSVVALGPVSDAAPSPVPEPSTFLLVGIGLFGAVITLKRFKG